MTLFRACFCAFLGLMMTSAALAETRTISDGESLRTTLREDLTGVTLALAPGRYPALVLRGATAPAAITSADPDRPARILGLRAQDIDGLTLENLIFDYQFHPEDRLHGRPFFLRRCANLTVRNNRFDGDYASGLGFPHDGHGYGMGLSLANCNNVLIENNFFQHFYKGINIRETRDLVIRGNELTALRMDGMTFAQVFDVLIEGNHFHNFERVDIPADHADMIQIWTPRTELPSRNVTIRGNILNSGAGLFTQSIFMRNALVDDGRAGEEMYYSNFTVENNLIINAHLHGITMGQVFGVTIRGNTLIQSPGSARPDDDPGRRLYIPRITVRPESTDVIVADNIVHDIVGFDGQPDWQVTGNLLLSETVGAVFVPRAVDPGAEARLRWRMVPGSAGDRPGLGSTLLRP